jgi:HD superfamily phosphohydrolase
MVAKPVKKKNFRVPNQDIKIKLHELLLINTRCFQRLFSIKQLGLVERIYPFATHTRAAHCLDCLAMAQRIVDSLKDNAQFYPLVAARERDTVIERIEEDTDLIRASALLHDIMHIPYAHSLEDETGVLPKGDKGDRIDKMISRIKGELDSLKSASSVGNYKVFSFDTEEEFDSALEHALQLLDNVKKVLWTTAFSDEELEEMNGSERKRYEKRRLDPERFYIADIIGNTICADLLSYILRDVEFTGIETKPGGWYRLFDYFRIQKDDKQRNRMVVGLTKKGELREDALSAIVGILNVRYALSEQVLYHHAKCAASAMLGKVAFLCGLNESEELYDIGDEGLITLLSQKIKGMKQSGDTVTKRKAEGAERLLDSLRARRFYKRFHRIPVSQQRPYGRPDLSEEYSSAESRIKLEEEIENEYGLQPGSILIWCPVRKMAMKEARVLVVYEDMDEMGQIRETVTELDSKVSRESLKRLHETLPNKVENVVEQYKALWKLYIFVEPSIISIYGKQIKERLVAKLGEGDRIFDSSYVIGTDPYKLSETIREHIAGAVPVHQYAAVYRQIPQALESIAQKAGTKRSLSWLREHSGDIVRAAIERNNAVNTQGRLTMEGYCD